MAYSGLPCSGMMFCNLLSSQGLWLIQVGPRAASLGALFFRDNEDRPSHSPFTTTCTNVASISPLSKAYGLFRLVLRALARCIFSPVAWLPARHGLRGQTQPQPTHHDIVSGPSISFVEGLWLIQIGPRATSLGTLLLSGSMATSSPQITRTDPATAHSPPGPGMHRQFQGPRDTDLWLIQALVHSEHSCLIQWVAASRSLEQQMLQYRS